MWKGISTPGHKSSDLEAPPSYKFHMGLKQTGEETKNGGFGYAHHEPAGEQNVAGPLELRVSPARREHVPPTKKEHLRAVTDGMGEFLRKMSQPSEPTGSRRSRTQSQADHTSWYVSHKIDTDPRTGARSCKFSTPGKPGRCEQRAAAARNGFNKLPNGISRVQKARKVCRRHGFLVCRRHGNYQKRFTKKCAEGTERMHRPRIRIELRNLARNTSTAPTEDYPAEDSDSDMSLQQALFGLA